MKTIICVALIAAVSSVQSMPDPWLSGVIDGIASLGTDMGKKTADIVSSSIDLGTDALKNSANVGLNTGKLALTGFGGVGKDVLDKAGVVGKEAIGIITNNYYKLFSYELVLSSKETCRWQILIKPIYTIFFKFGKFIKISKCLLFNHLKLKTTISLICALQYKLLANIKVI